MRRGDSTCTKICATANALHKSLVEFLGLVAPLGLFGVARQGSTTTFSARRNVVVQATHLHPRRAISTAVRGPGTNLALGHALDGYVPRYVRACHRAYWNTFFYCVLVAWPDAHQLGLALGQALASVLLAWPPFFDVAPRQLYSLLLGPRLKHATPTIRVAVCLVYPYPFAGPLDCWAPLLLSRCGLSKR